MSKNLPPYLVKILALEAAGQIPRGKTSLVLVAHDDWCPLLTGTNLCACDPDVVIKAATRHGDAA